MNRFALSLLVILSALSSFAFATDEKESTPDYKKAESQLSTKCQVGKTQFQLHLGHEKDADEDAQKEYKEFGYPFFWITTKNGKTFAALPALQDNELLFLKSNSKSLCQDTAAFAQPDGSIAIFVKQSGRPFEDLLSVVVYNPTREKVIAFRRGLESSTRVEKTPHGIAFEVNDRPTDVTQFDVTVHGKPATTSEENFKYWDLLVVKGKEVTSKTDRKLTWAKNSYKDYFKSQSDFDKAFGWDNKKEIYQTNWVYQVKDPNCIQPSKERAVFNINSLWYCDRKTPVYQPTNEEISKCRIECNLMKKENSFREGMTVESCREELCDPPSKRSESSIEF